MLGTSRRYPRWLVALLVVEFVLPALLLFLLVPEPQTLFVTFAGPWAARLYGHSCGMDSFLPLGAWGLLAFGIVSLTVAWFIRRPYGVIPVAALWWPAWLVGAFLSVLNTLE